MDKAKKRKARKEELEKLTSEQLGDIRPYKKGKVTASKTEKTEPKRISKAEMIETILAHEGLGKK